MQNDVYATSDLYVSAYLALHFPIESLDRSNPRRVQFLFRNEQGLEEAVEAYWNGAAKVSPMALFSSARNLKHRIYDQP